MSLRLKLALAFALIAALAAVAVSLLSYRAARSQLFNGVDRSLSVAAQGGASSLTEPDPPLDRPAEGRIDVRPPPAGTGALGNQLFVVQRINRNGDIVLTGSPELPVNAADRALSRLGKAGFTNLRSLRLSDGERLRMASASLSGGGAVQVARSVESISRDLDRLRTQALILTLVVVLVAALLGAALAGTITRRLVALTRSAEQVARTGALDQPVGVGGKDEIGRLAGVFTRMLHSLRISRDQQQRLVQDAGHELRTPLTSITTNLSLLRRYQDMDPKTRREVLGDLEAEAGEMSQIISDLVSLTSIGEDEQLSEVNLSQLLEELALRSSRRYGREVRVEGPHTVIVGKPRALRHALSNLLDNAAKFDTSASPIEVILKSDRVEVKDRGPGISESERELVFDRFYRSVGSRSAPGSGLGLAIVQEVALQHKGHAFARNRRSGGAAVGFSWSQDLQ